MRFAVAKALFCLLPAALARAGGGGGPETVALLASDGEAGDRFGASVALDGAFLLIGADEDDDLGSNAGSAYARRLVAGVWTDEQKLVAPDGSGGDHFGKSVSISGPWAVVGSPKDDEAASNAGAAHLFRFNGSHWSHFAKLIAPDAEAGDWFGVSVAIDGGRLVVGAMSDDDTASNSGSAHVYEWSGTSWDHAAKLVASDASGSAFLGWSVAIDGQVIVAGAYGIDEVQLNSGAAYAFRRTPTGTWVQEQRLRPDDPGYDVFFGWSVDVSGDSILVGAPNDATNGAQAGAAYAFEHGDGTWTQQQKLLASNGTSFDNFGRQVAIDGNRAVIGAHLRDEGFPDAGAAYTYRLEDGSWIERMTLSSPTAYYWDTFGSSVAIDGEFVVAGAAGDDDSGNNSGSAFVVSLEMSSCPADADGSGAVDFGDIIAVVQAWGPCNGCPEDIDGDDAVTFGDIFAIIATWGSCP